MNYNLCIALLSLLFSLNILSQSIPYNQEFQINTYSDFNQINPCVSKLSNGGFIFCWESWNQDGSRLGIFAQAYDDSGVKTGSEFQVNTATYYDQKNPYVIGLTNGKYLICWEGYDESRQGIYAQLYNENNVRIGNEFRVNTYTNEAQLRPSATELINGNFVISWSSDIQDGSWDGIFAKIFDENGNPIGDEFQVNSHTSDPQLYPEVCGLTSGGFVITWTSYWQDDGFQGGDGVYAQLFNANGVKLGNEFLVNTHTLNSQTFSSVDKLVNGNFVVCWQSLYQDGSSWGIYAQIFDENGTKVGSEFQVNSFTSDWQNLPIVCGLDNGSFIICWQSKSQDASWYGVYAQVFNEVGSQIGNEFRVNDYSYRERKNPFVCAANDSGFVVCWDSYMQDGSAEGIFAKYFLGEIIDHELIQFDIITQSEANIINTTSSALHWSAANEVRINLPWELTYELYLDDNLTFSNPSIIARIQDTIMTIFFSKSWINLLLESAGKKLLRRFIVEFDCRKFYYRHKFYYGGKRF